jgi:hypothetical protein
LEGGRTDQVFAIDEAFRVRHELLFSFVLLGAFFDCAFQDPGQGLGNHGVSLVDDGVAAAASLVPFCYAAAVASSAVTRSVGGDGGRGHDFMVEGEGLEGLENCCCHFERVIVRSFSGRMGILEGTEDEKEEKLKREFLS